MCTIQIDVNFTLLLLTHVLYTTRQSRLYLMLPGGREIATVERLFDAAECHAVKRLYHVAFNANHQAFEERLITALHHVHATTVPCQQRVHARERRRSVLHTAQGRNTWQRHLEEIHTTDCKLLYTARVKNTPKNFCHFPQTAGNF